MYMYGTLNIRKRFIDYFDSVLLSDIMIYHYIFVIHI